MIKVVTELVKKWSYKLSQSERPRLEALVKNTTMEKNFTVNGRDGVQRQVKLLLKASNNEPTFIGHYTDDLTEDTDVRKILLWK